MDTDPETRETQNAESPQNYTLDPCPIEGCTAEGHHFHNRQDGRHNRARAGHLLSCATEPRCYTTAAKPEPEPEPEPEPDADPIPFALDPCPEPGCTAEGHHFHSSRTGQWGLHGLGGVGPACHLEPRCYTTAAAKPEPDSDPLDLPTAEEVAEEMKEALRSASGSRFRDVAQAILDLVRSRVTAWEPIDPDAIKPGMRVRLAQHGAYVAFTVMFTDWDYIYGGLAGPWAKEWLGRTWEVDPRTVPTEPEDPRVAAVRVWLEDDGDSSDADIRNLLACLDKMGGESK